EVRWGRRAIAPRPCEAGLARAGDGASEAFARAVRRAYCRPPSAAGLPYHRHEAWWHDFAVELPPPASLGASAFPGVEHQVHALLRGELGARLGLVPLAFSDRAAAGRFGE